jgi:hypothetical protein
MTKEEAIERIVERSMTILDKQLLTNQLSQDAYDEEVKALDEWSREMYANHIDEVF